MKTTTNYGLKKPEGTEHYSVANFNDNMDTIDIALKSYETEFGSTVISTTSNISLTAKNSIVFCNATSSNIVVTLPTAVGDKYKYIIKKTDSSTNTLTINTVNGQTIDGNATFVFDYGDLAFTIISDGSKWFVTSRYGKSGFGY